MASKGGRSKSDRNRDFRSERRWTGLIVFAVLTRLTDCNAFCLVAPIMYAFGDKQDQIPETLDLMNSIVVEYIEGMTLRAMASTFSGQLTEESLLFAIRGDKRKCHRAQQLLAIYDRIKARREVGIASQIKHEEQLVKNSGDRKRTGRNSFSGDSASGTSSVVPTLATKKRKGENDTVMGLASSSKSLKRVKNGQNMKPLAKSSKVSATVDKLLSEEPNLKDVIGGSSGTSPAKP